MTRLRLALAALLLVLGSAGCAALDAAFDTEEALMDAGFADATVWWASYDGVETLEVFWVAQARSGEELTEESLAAAGVVWRVAPVRFDVVRTEPDVSFTRDEIPRDFDRATLEREFGPRPPGLDRSIRSLLDIDHYLRWAVLGSVLFLLSSALIVWLVLRSSRRLRAAAV